MERALRGELVMRVILTEDVPSLGGVGSIVNVKNGYARNFLIPRSVAVVANEGNSKELDHKKKILDIKRKKVLAEAKELADQIEKITVSIFKQIGEESRIFGSVTSAEISEELSKHGIKISKKEIHFSEEIKKTGLYTGEIKIHSEISAKIKVKVEALVKE